MKKFWKLYRSRVYKNFMGKLTLSDGIEFWRSKLFFAIILYLLPLALILLIPSIIMTHFMKLNGLAIAYGVFAATILFISLSPRLNITHRKYSFLGLLYLVAISLIYFMGEHGAGITYLFGITVFALLILPEKAGKITVFINIGIVLIHAYSIYSGYAEYPLRDSFQVISWLLISGNSILLSIMAVIFMPMLLDGLQDTIEEQGQLEKTLRIQQQDLENSLKEKETLLAEIHHRVKNNLAVISGMMQLQSFKEPNEELQKKLLESTLRIKSMANIHEQLYQSHSFSNISFDTGLKTLTHTILETIYNGVEIETEFDLEAVELSINQAIPCSLIVNEVVTNSVKHAFERHEKGLISIALKQDNERVLLKISDNGAGMEGSAHEMNQDSENTSLGMELIEALVIQLEADYRYHSPDLENGTTFELSFTLNDPA
jgi:two-component sensor histidine kinase